MKFSNLIIFWTILFFCCCQIEEEKFERTDELLAYLNDIHQINLVKNNNSFVVIISGSCGSCTKETVEILKKLGSDPKFISFKKYILIPELNSDIIPELEQNLDNKFNIVRDHDLKMMRYGIQFSKNIFLELDYNKIIYWEWLYLDKIYNVRKHYWP